MLAATEQYSLHFLFCSDLGALATDVDRVHVRIAAEVVNLDTGGLHTQQLPIEQARATALSRARAPRAHARPERSRRR